MAAGGSAAVALTECEAAWQAVPARSIVATVFDKKARLAYRDDRDCGTYIWCSEFNSLRPDGWRFPRDSDGVLQGTWGWYGRDDFVVIVRGGVNPCLSNDQIKALVSLCTAINTSA